MSPGFYVYRTTTDKLGESLNRISDSGDQIRETVHVGGRDWVVVCVKADNRG